MKITSCLVIITLDAGHLSLIYFRIASIWKIKPDLLPGLPCSFTDPTKCPKCMLFTLRDQTIYNNEQSPA